MILTWKVKNNFLHNRKRLNLKKIIINHKNHIKLKIKQSKMYKKMIFLTNIKVKKKLKSKTKKCRKINCNKIEKKVIIRKSQMRVKIMKAAKMKNLKMNQLRKNNKCQSKN